LQPIILQSYIIFTLVLSKIILGRSYKRQQIISVLVLFLGILVSLIPIFIQIASGEDLAFQSGAYWGVILFVSTAPAALMNIKEEEVFEENPNYDIALLIAWESLIQVLFVGFCFWADLVPHFGTSTSLRELVTNFENGMSCVFFENSLPGTHCQYCMLFIILFGLAYCGAYYFSAYLMKYASANYNSAVSSVVSPAGTIWWCVFTGVAKWIGAPPTNTTDILYCLLSFVFIIPASWYFKKFDMIEKEKKHEEHAHLRDSIVNSDD
jgi:drug/metabolite transporter (DMT)-like permease